jgi:tetratricopeptide (TPR) repeat protein
MAMLAAAAVHDPASPGHLVPAYRQHYTQAEKRWGTQDPRLARLAADTGRFLLSLGDRSGAWEMLERAAKIEERVAHPDSSFLAELLEQMAAADPRRAIELLDRSIAIRQEQPAEAGKLVEIHRRIGDLLSSQRQTVQALDRYRTAVQIAEQRLDKDDPRLAAALADLGFALEAEERFREAEPLYRRALAIQRKRLGARHPEVGVTLNNLAGVVGASGRLAEAEPLLRGALQVLESTLGPNHARVAAAASNLADLLAALGRPAAARPLWRRSMAVYEQLGDHASAAEVRASESRALAAPSKKNTPR